MQKIYSKAFHQIGPQINCSREEAKHRQMRVGKREFYPSFLWGLQRHNLYMIQTSPSWGGGDESWHGGQVSPAGSPEPGCRWTKPGSSPTVGARALHYPSCMLVAGTAAPWPVSFCRGSQWLLLHLLQPSHEKSTGHSMEQGLLL